MIYKKLAFKNSWLPVIIINNRTFGMFWAHNGSTGESLLLKDVMFANFVMAMEKS